MNLPIAMIKRGDRHDSDMITRSDVSNILGISKLATRIDDILDAADVKPVSAHRLGTEYHPLYSRAQIEALKKKRDDAHADAERATQAAADNAKLAVRAKSLAGAPDPTLVMEFNSIKQQLQAVISACASSDRLTASEQLATRRVISDSELRIRADINKGVAGMADMIAELDGRLNTLTKECGAVAAFVMGMKG